MIERILETMADSGFTGKPEDAARHHGFLGQFANYFAEQLFSCGVTNVLGLGTDGCALAPQLAHQLQNRQRKTVSFSLAQLLNGSRLEISPRDQQLLQQQEQKILVVSAVLPPRKEREAILRTLSALGCVVAWAALRNQMENRPNLNIKNCTIV